MKYIVSPDSFKGSISATDFCEVVSKTILSIQPDAQISSLPLADGGEGSLDCILSALPGNTDTIKVTSAFLGEKKDVRIGFFDEGKTAVIESSLAMGLPSIGDRKNPELTTSLGVGQMINYAISCGAETIILTLGGSSTNDCGAGLLAALGTQFYDEEGKFFIPTGGNLKNIKKIDFSEMKEKIKGVEFIAMCDVDNPLCGENGCSYVFGPQKGADEQMVKRLDENCRYFADLIQRMDITSPVDADLIPGAGAAGGLGFCCVACLNGELKNGIQTILELYDFDTEIEDCNCIITGEGCFDSQSMMGKTVGGLVKRVKEFEANTGKIVPIRVICGLNKSEGGNPYITSISEISSGQTVEYSMEHAPELIEAAVRKLLS